MLLFLYTHLIEALVVLSDSKRVEVLLHAEVFAHITAFQPSREVDRHEPADDVTTSRNELSNDVELDLIPKGRFQSVLLHHSSKLLAVVPLVNLYLMDGFFGFRVFHRTGVSLVGKGSGFFG